MRAKNEKSGWWREWISLGIVFGSGVAVFNALFGRFPIYFLFPFRPIFTIPVSVVCEVIFWAAFFLLAGLLAGLVRFLACGNPYWHRGGQVAVLLVLEAFLVSVLFDVMMRRGLFRFFAPPTPRSDLFFMALPVLAGLVALAVIIAGRRRLPEKREADGRKLGFLALVFGALYALVFNRAMASTQLPMPLPSALVLLRPHLAGLAALFLGAVLIGYFARRRDWTITTLARFSAAAAGLAAVILTVYYGLPSRDHRPNIIVSLWDAARASRMSVYGYEKDTTPFLEELVPRSLIFERPYTPANYTLPSHASFFLGLPYRAHGYHLGDGKDVIRYREELTLPERLGEQGYYPVLFSENPWVLAVDKGFAEVRFFEKPALYADLYPGGGCEIGTRVSPRRYPQAFPGLMLLDWFRYWRDGFYAFTLDRIQLRAVAELFLRSHRTGPVFLFWNLMNVHDRYHPRGDWRYNQLVEDYDFAGEYDLSLTYADRRFQDLYQLTEYFGQLPRTLFIVTSDHGEFLGEYNLVGHHKGLFEPVLRVPLILIYPGLDYRRVFAPVSLDRFSQLVEAVAAGESGLAREVPEAVFLPGESVIAEHGYLADQRSEEFTWSYTVIEPEWQLIHDPDLRRHRSSWPPEEELFLFDLRRDPAGEKNVAEEYPEQVSRLKEIYREYLRGLDERRQVRRQAGLSEDLERQLRSVGYLR